MDIAPKFDSTPACLIPFLEDVDAIADHALLTDEQWIKAALRYAPIEEAETWEMLNEAALPNWKKFIAVVKLLYPGCEGNHHFTHTDLENLCAEQVCMPMTSQEELGQYYHKFFKISRHLIVKKKLADLECDCLFLDRFHITAKTAIMRWLEIKLTDHHLDDPYDIKEVYNTAVFLLPSTSLASAPKPTQASLSWGTGQCKDWMSSMPSPMLQIKL
ncbi:hypothetical protein BDR04DRAFT_1160914 [Suillus decipiens]|nr:hypothetical protein BDR04DRAFT_1160914 [Suillus decipiens]